VCVCVVCSYKVGALCVVCSYKVGTLNAAESSSAARDQRVHVMYDHVPHKLVPPRRARRTKWMFLTVVATSKQRVEQFYDEGDELS